MYTRTKLILQVPLIMSSQFGKFVILIYNVNKERLTADAKVATVLGSIPAFSDTEESEGRQMKQY
jgi:hypothetical protein